MIDWFKAATTHVVLALVVPYVRLRLLFQPQFVIRRRDWPWRWFA